MHNSWTAVGRNQSAISTETEIALSYADIGGADEAKEELLGIVAFLKDPMAGGTLGGRMPKAVLLVGPPGTGKTLLARATAGEAKVPFLPINGAELIEGGASSVRDLFEEARHRAPAILFIDDLDRLGCCNDINAAHRGPSGRGRLLNQFLIALDQLDSGAGVLVLAATNCPDTLDPALLRAGRFEPVPVTCPDKPARGRILHLHTRMIRLSADVDLMVLAASTPGFTGADLVRLVNKAALLATRRGADAVTASDFSRAIDRIFAGVEAKTLALSAHEREVMAYHEIGHALIALSLPGSAPVDSISMLRRNIGSGSCSMQQPTEDRFLMVRQELENKITVLLAGRAAEQLVFGEVSTYGSIDLQGASAIARDIAARYGMTAEIGQVSSEELSPSGHRSQISYSEETARQIDGVVKSLICRTFSRAVELLRAQREILERGARLLIDHETLDAADLSALRQRHWSRNEENHDGA